ncbi:homeoprotein [Cordyceps fumosorosea ARSEF 2679]|uniref:Homeoprotein n=1 Tax=Cordyceps fumosorosea (strain ARSEF 2679) TaxID=1081104 RepID=A0A162K660_CORFA|nr:homeoprotein [Cordyceps fumosorosea ARSEF 2679]OAA53858.1 homeoprotein [Cordyceps fumosorosea ARSEF 2679]
MATEVEMPVSMVPMHQAPESSSPNSSTAPGSATATSSKRTPSPTASTTGHASGGISKRPPRKSTLTQQQKNHKRQRATQDQLATLEVEFNKNPTPTANVRDRIANEINMTERSVQIWFQNRRAKIKLLAKKSLETGEDIDAIPESMRNYLAMQAMESGKSLGGSYLGRNGLVPFGHGNMLLGEQAGTGKVLIQHLSCRSLSIGKWNRVCQATMDLIIFYSPEKCTMTYYINSDQSGYKIEYPFAYIKSIYLENSEGDPMKLGGIVIELNRPPNFFMDSPPSAGGFYQVGDFTEDSQASTCLIHHLGGTPKVLSGQLAKLISLESFMNRHNTMAFATPSPNVAMEAHAIAASAPVSPIPRPSSQPNFGPSHMGMMPDQNQWGIGQMHSAMRPPQGHKRQRSRSVPGPIDFAMFQNQPMPSFYISAPTDMGPPQTPGVYAPIPQQPNMANNLRIDTQAGFGLDMRQYPMSATTASPADFPHSPSFFSQGHDGTPLATPGYTPAYGGAYMSPMVGSEANGPTSSSLGFAGNEPTIVDQSPPMGMMGRPDSAGMYPGQDGSCAVSEDGTTLNDMYSKHSLISPNFVQPQQAELDMDQLVHFDAVDPSSLSPPEAVASGPQ